MAKPLQPGDPAPEIALPDQDGKTRTLSELRGKWVLVYFYPRDDTPGCTLEACGVRDAWGRFTRAGIEVLGVSADSIRSHKKFVDKLALPFRLLADETKQAIQAYGVWGRKKFMGREFDGILRQSFLVDRTGKIAMIYPKVKSAEHAQQVLEDVALLSRSGASLPSKAETRAPAKPKKAAKKPRR